MKVLLAVIFCVVARGVMGGAVAWPGGSLVNTLIHPSTKGFAYSTSQYINALPASYSYGIRPQLAYPIHHVGAFGPLPGLPAYYPVSSGSYIPASSIFYPQLSPTAPFQPQPAPSPPSAPIAPIAPGAPSLPEQPNRPSLPSDQPNGDADTTVIESAEFVKSQQGQQQTAKSDNADQAKSSDRVLANSYQGKQSKDTVNLFNRNPQVAQLASFAPIPQLPLGIPQYSQFPQRNPFLQLPELPQLPQLPEFPQLPELPQVPEFPQFPQLPQIPPSQSSPPQAPQSPSVPQFPSSQGEPSQQQPQLPQLPQFPPSQGSSSPQFPQLPSFPQFPPSQGSSSPQQIAQLPAIPQFPQLQLPNFPSADNSNKGLNDEDTISVESA